MVSINGENEDAFQGNPKWIIQINNLEKEFIFCFMIWLKIAKAQKWHFYAWEETGRVLKSLGPLGLGSSGRFGSPATTEARGVWPLSSQPNTNIWKSENPFQKRRHSDSVFWNQQTGPPVAEMLKSLTKPGATNYVDWNKLLSSEPWTSILNVAVGNILKCIYVHFWDMFYIWILFNKYINIRTCQYTGKINVN